MQIVYWAQSKMVPKERTSEMARAQDGELRTLSLEAKSGAGRAGRANGACTKDLVV